MSDEKEQNQALTGVLIEDHIELTLADICRVCTVREESIVALVEEGVLRPRGERPGDWRFTETSLRRTAKAMRIQHDLEINTAGVAVILELLEEIESLRAKLDGEIRR